MTNPFKYSNDNKRYHTLAYHNSCSNIKWQKAVIDAGLTCPNIDGSKSVGGCIFCSGGSGYFTHGSVISITDQIKLEVERIKAKNPTVSVTAYFQAHTNTYCEPLKLESMLGEALSTGMIDGLAIATRPDCLSPDIMDILNKYSLVVPLTVELGLQTVSDDTAELINRRYSYEEFISGFTMLKNNGIRTCVHIIDGLPGEDKAMMLNTARSLASLRPDAVKIHLLHVIMNTRLADMYCSGNYFPLSFEEYVDAVVSQLELLPEETVIERITGDADKSQLLAPLWSRDKIRVLGTIDKEMAIRNTWQGRLFVAEK